MSIPAQVVQLHSATEISPEEQYARLIESADYDSALRLAHVWELMDNKVGNSERALCRHGTWMRMQSTKLNGQKHPCLRLRLL